MTDVNDEREEFALRALVGREIPPIADEGFARSVVGRMRRRIWQRRLTLLSATAIGLLIALPFAGQLLVALSTDFVEFISRAEESEVLGQFRVLLTLLPVRETANAASEELQQLTSLAWLSQYQTYILTGLLAVGSLVTARMLER